MPDLKTSSAPDPRSSPNEAIGSIGTCVRQWLHKHRGFVIGLTCSLAGLAVIEFAMGRTLFGPDGKFGWWEGDIWSSANSQRVADAYSFSHIGHGLIFFGALALLRRPATLPGRFWVAAFAESAWEILENSPIIINRYREATIALGYTGDSVLNSASDLLMMSLGFFIASRWRPWQCAALFLGMEAGCALWVRDNLILNVIMLVWPVEAIKAWQLAGQPAGL